MSKKDTRGRKKRSDHVRVVPEFREQIDIEKLCQALIEIAKSLSRDSGSSPVKLQPGNSENKKSLSV